MAAALRLHRQGSAHGRGDAEPARLPRQLLRERSALRIDTVRPAHGANTNAYKMSFTNFGTGNSHGFGGEYRELEPGAKIVYTDKFDDPNLPGAMLTTVTLRAVLVGTDMTVEQEGIPEAIPVEQCYLGWQQSLLQLAKLVEPNIPD